MAAEGAKQVLVVLNSIARGGTGETAHLISLRNTDLCILLVRHFSSIVHPPQVMTDDIISVCGLSIDLDFQIF